MSDTLTVRNVARHAESASTGVMLAHGEECMVPRDEHTEAMIAAGHFIEIPADTPPPADEMMALTAEEAAAVERGDTSYADADELAAWLDTTKAAEVVADVGDDVVFAKLVFAGEARRDGARKSVMEPLVALVTATREAAS